MKLAYLIILVFLPLAALVAEEPAKEDPVYTDVNVNNLFERSVPGLPVWPGRRLGGFYKYRSPEELKKALAIKPPAPQPEDVTAKFIRVVGSFAIGVSIAGFCGLIFAGFLLYRASVWWDDVAVVGIMCAGGGSALAYNFKSFVIVSTVGSAGFVAYVIYTAIRKKRLAQARDEAVDTVEVVKTLSEWNDSAKVAVSKVQTPLFTKHLEHSEKTRTADRLAKIDKAVAACKTAAEGVQSS